MKHYKLEYLNEDVILTEFGEIMTYKEAKNTNTLVERIATGKEADGYIKETKYWKKQDEQGQHEGSYHELPD